ncbi:hypothetical protein XENOCAPTIV_024773 [Xenoophorus captivus]|uniref:BED-type domain-containing protein n=1 Tax=Xenoophorus captivus TaxID=1517983 RepID=A0ABV0RFC0_9TELE
MASSKEDLVPNKDTTSSIIWNWFGFATTDLEQHTARCKICLNPVATKDGSTTNLFQYVKQKHSVELGERLLSTKSSGQQQTRNPCQETTHLRGIIFILCSLQKDWGSMESDHGCCCVVYCQRYCSYLYSGKVWLHSPAENFRRKVCTT